MRGSISSPGVQIDLIRKLHLDNSFLLKILVIVYGYQINFLNIAITLTIYFVFILEASFRKTVFMNFIVNLSYFLIGPCRGFTCAVQWSKPCNDLGSHSNNARHVLVRLSEM